MVLLKYVIEKYGLPYDENVAKALIDENKKDNSLKVWSSFVRVVSDAIEKEESDAGQTISVCMSSTWAICQEYLGNLQGQDAEYTKMRSGTWRIDDSKIISFREIVEDLKNSFPEWNESFLAMANHKFNK